jgi:predicted DNA-binding protein
MATKKQYQETSVGLNEKDRLRLAELSRLQGRTKTEVAREAIRWYMDNYENIKNQSRDSEVAQAIRYATDQIVKAINSGVERICRMLARQGAQIGTLYEFSYMVLPNDPNAVAVFEAASSKAKQNQRKHVERDEAELAEAMKKVLTK